jgi:TetR/AcrR family transcriptional repressor of nem operon
VQRARLPRQWQQAAERKQGSKAFRSIVEGYLSREHRDSPGQGCVVAALGADIARQPQSVRDAFTKELEDVFEFLAGLMPGNDPARRYHDAIATFAGITGALILARAVNDETLSERILQAMAKRVGDLPNSRKRTRRS